MFSLTVIGSSSDGNCTLVHSEKTAVLIDAGLSRAHVARVLAGLPLAPTMLRGVVVSHDHVDHCRGLNSICRGFSIPAHTTAKTEPFLKLRDSVQVCYFVPGEHFDIGDIRVVPFAIPHDAIEPVGFTLSCEGIKFAIATDLGHLPGEVRDHLRGADVILIESNHNIEMLRVGPYPPKIKQRIASDIGHLSNDETAEFIEQDMDGRTSTLILGHLSKENNHPEIVSQVARRALKGRQVNLVVVDPSNPEPLTFTY